MFGRKTMDGHEGKLSPETPNHGEPKHEDTESATLPSSSTSVEKQPGHGTIAQEPPEGGLIAWLAVLAFFLAIMNTWYFPSPPLHQPPKPLLTTTTFTGA